MTVNITGPVVLLNDWPSDFVGSILRKARRRKGLTLAELAILVECSSATIHRWEQGRYSSRLKKIVPRLISVLDLDVDEFSEAVGFADLHLPLSTPPPAGWTVEEDNLMRRYQSLPSQQIAALSNRTVKAVYARRFTLGIGVASPRWTEEEDVILRQHLFPSRIKKLGLLSHRSEKAIFTRGQILGLRLPSPDRAYVNSWSPDEDMILRENNHMSLAEIMLLLPNRTRGAIIARRGRFKSGFCAMADCNKLSIARGFCPMHYRRWLIYDDPLVVTKFTNKGRKCLEVDCQRVAYIKGLCKRHYERSRKLLAI